MVAYVLALWLGLGLLFILIQLSIRSLLLQKGANAFIGVHQELTQIELIQSSQGKFLSLLTGSVGLFLLPFLGGILCELALSPAQKLNQNHHKRYPDWYAALPAVWRGALIALMFWGLCALTLLFVSPLSSLGLLLGGITPSLWRTWSYKREDRPEGVPKALIESLNLVKNHPTERALLIGKIYLRWLLPLLVLSLCLFLPGGNYFNNWSPLSYLTLFAGLLSGISIGVYALPQTQFSPDFLKSNFLTLGSLMALAGGVSLFAIYSENLIVLGLGSLISGLTLASY